jgi:predicted RND superfamily exporter protein
MRSRDALTGVALLRTSTPRAVAFSALTTILSFGSLAVSTHRGTASMGVLLTIAIGFTLLGGLIALPALMGWLDARRSEQS